MPTIDTPAGRFQVTGIAFPDNPANVRAVRLYSREPIMTVDIVELTKRFGLPDHEQSAVASWTGDPYGTTWDEAEADQLHQIWEADQLRIDDERG